MSKIEIDFEKKQVIIKDAINLKELVEFIDNSILSPDEYTILSYKEVEYIPINAYPTYPQVYPWTNPITNPFVTCDTAGTQESPTNNTIHS